MPRLETKWICNSSPAARGSGRKRFRPLRMWNDLFDHANVIDDFEVECQSRFTPCYRSSSRCV
jgi:hypothetical protein